MMRYPLVLLTVLIACGISCLPPPLLIDNVDKNKTVQFISAIYPDSVVGAADISMKIQKRVYSGNLTVKKGSNSFFNAEVFSILGTEVASVKCDSQVVRLNYGDRNYLFNNESAMDSLPFCWSKYFTLNEFKSFFTGNMTDLRSTLESQPDTISNGSTKNAILKWLNNDRHLNLELTLDRKKTIPVALKIQESGKLSSWSIVFKNFRNGRAYSILFIEDDNNYFSIEYDNLKFFNGMTLL